MHDDSTQLIALDDNELSTVSGGELADNAFGDAPPPDPGPVPSSDAPIIIGPLGRRILP